MRTITLSNNKGGSAKTTTAVSLAAAFAETGLRVLVVDLDPQGSATFWLGGRELDFGLVEFSEGGVRVAQLLRTSSAPGVDLIPTSPSLVPSGEKSPNDTGLAIVRGFARLPDYWDIVLGTPRPRWATCRSRPSWRAITCSSPSRSMPLPSRALPA